MFKLESYITPILLSYVDKYIKNFRPEDSQVSLWGGDASFHNLDLRLEVLEQELQLPFSFVSGHIHELLIHVPWTKLASEPITITINTIECILKLRGDEESTTSLDGGNLGKEKSKKNVNRRQEVEAPPGYVQSLINKIVSNIRIYCNNLILKYVEEDIVLSLNVKLLTFESANDKWESAYTELSPAQVILRKLISLNDLTLCLDKRNAAGKIDVYQEPMLYRCSLTMHLLRNYHSATAKRASTTRLDIYCNKMEFSMTEQQVPMLVRLIALCIALQQKQFRRDNDVQNDAISAVAEIGESTETQESWAGWAWSFVPSILPVAWDEDWNSEQEIPQSGHTVQLGFYVDSASITFKVSETSSDRGYYSQRKLRYWPLMSLHIQGVYMETIMHGINWFNVSAGVSEAIIVPVGYCSCGHNEIVDGTVPPRYLSAGSVSTGHKTDSLFDAEAVENKGKRRMYSFSWDYRLSTITEAVLLERTPAFAFDYLYQLEVPDDMTSERLSELGSDLEFSNLSERSLMRLVVGPLKLRICSGFFHRFSSLRVAAAAYDYPPYSVPNPEPPLSDLLPPSSEDYDALNECIPTRTTQITVFAPIIEFQLMDHPYFEPVKGNLFRKRMKISVGVPSVQNIKELPKLTLECQCIDIKISNPMYLKRLIHTTCQLPDPPQLLFNMCYTDQSVKIIGFCSRLIVSAKKHTTIITPCGASYTSRSIHKPQYWIQPDVPHYETTFESEAITITGTKAKMMIVAHIVDKFLKGDIDNSLHSVINSSLLHDAARDYGLTYLEFCLEAIRFKKVETRTTVTLDMSLGGIKAFIFEPSEAGAQSSDFNSIDAQQVLFISGPEPTLDFKSTRNLEDAPLFSATVQYPLNPVEQPHPSILVFNLQEMRICVDPLLCRWLLYSPKYVQTQAPIFDPLLKTKRNLSEATGGMVETPRRAGTLHESVHSSSDREQLYIRPRPVKRVKENDVDFQETVYNFLKKWFDVWKGMLICGDLSHCTMYFPIVSLSAVGSQGIQEAMEIALKKDLNPEILVLTFPRSSIRSASQKQGLKSFIKSLPVKLPDNLWTIQKSSFPWSMTITDFNCYTLQHNQKLYFLKPVSLSATVGLSTKPSKDVKTENISTQSSFIESTSKSDIGSLGVCVHIDMTPINISTSEIQVCLMASILYGLMEVIRSLTPEQTEKPEHLPEIVPPLTTNSSSKSPTILKESTLASGSETTPILPFEKSDVDVKLTAWIQWTIARFTFELFSHSVDGFSSSNEDYLMNPNVKLVIDAEDIVSSLDFQSVYLKIKNKIGSANIRHFVRQNPSTKWKPGPFLGIIMLGREDTSVERQEDTSFANVTITRASCQVTHTLWGAAQKAKHKDKKDPRISEGISQSRYITEIVVNVQPVDFILPITTLKSFCMALEPLMKLPSKGAKVETNKPLYSHLNNQTLPLAYLECRGIRFLVPSIELGAAGLAQDVCMFQIDRINLNPTAVNPICRTPCRPDIYQHAAQARILHVPGSEVEDRQYQLDIIGLSMNTGIWEELDPILSTRVCSTSPSATINENPAFEWNNLEKGRLSITPHLNLWPLINKFDITVVAAPALVYGKDTIVCGNSIEVNFVSDIEIYLALSQIQLASVHFMEFLTLFEPFYLDQGIHKRPKIVFPYPKLDRPSYESLFQEESIISSAEIVVDSGIETADIKSFSTKTKESFVNTIHTPFKATPSDRSESKSSSVFPRPPNPLPQSQQTVPVEIFFAGGKITFILYHMEKGRSGSLKISKRRPDINEEQNDPGYEASEEGSIDENITYEHKQYEPLLFMRISEPNAFLSRQHLTRKIQLSCFNVSIKIREETYNAIRVLPTEAHFPVPIIETRPGIPSADTGISPAFFTTKWVKSLGKPPSVNINIAKPTKILCSLYRWSYILSVKDRVIYSFHQTFKDPQYQLSRKFSQLMAMKQPSANKGMSWVPQKQDFHSKFKRIKDGLYNIHNLNIKLAQIVFVLKSTDGSEINFNFGNLRSHLSISNRPERVTNVINLEYLTLGIIMSERKKLLLNPWTFSIEICLFWEPWQNNNNDPQIQISVDSDNLVLDVSPDHIKCIEKIALELKQLVATYTIINSYQGESVVRELSNLTSTEKDHQYYKDDLRAGAFQFVDSATNNADELPLPYQVMFWQQNICAMAWRYPHPRTLTKVRVFPVPFKVTNESEEDLQVTGHLEYWSDIQGCYIRCAQFTLSETEMCYLELPETPPKPPVSCTWRVSLTAQNDKVDHMLISPRALAACMRIDSYFNKSLIPNLNVGFHMSQISISLCNSIDKLVPVKMPAALETYNCDMMFPDNQGFIKCSLENIDAYLKYWDADTAAVCIRSSLSCSVLDYTYLTQQIFLEPFTSKLDISMSENMDINFISKSISVRFGPCIAHTLAVSAQMWEQSWANKENIDLIVMTHFVICNDTNLNLRFSQMDTDEDILLPPRYCHLYSWRTQKIKQLLRVGVEENGWVWSTPFSIEKGTKLCRIASEKDIVLLVTVKELSATQLQVTFSGQLIIRNMLQEKFEVKVVKAVTDDKEREFKRTPVNIIEGQSAPPSLVIDASQKYFLRLRFSGLESAWSGDIPLVEHTRCAQPWLVKVPLHDRGQFLSVWCRIIKQDVPGGCKILAMLWPLFMVRSNLPISSKVLVETPTLNVSLESNVNGKGEYQQLYCPGTIDHSHQLTFKLNGGGPITNPYVPLNYSLVDQKQFFKRPDYCNIDDILEIVSNYNKSKWPYFGDELDDIDWIMEEQPLTHVQVRYQNACQHSSALLVELVPWCMLVNTLGCAVSIIVNDKEICKACHHGLVTPPKLEDTFNIALRIGEAWHRSAPLQLAKSDWSQTFYMPKITGTIPLEGNIKTAVRCGSNICMVSISSIMSNDMRLLKLSSTHVLTNHLNRQMQVICLAVADSEIMHDFPQKVENYSFTIAPHLDQSKSGVSVLQWYFVGNETDPSADFALYISLAADPALGWSCPVRVDKHFLRRSVVVLSENGCIPLLLTSQEHKGQIYLSLHSDCHPQMLIENNCEIKLYCAQYADSDKSFVTKDSQHFNWTCGIQSDSAMYYTMAALSERFPDLTPSNYPDKICFSSDPQIPEEELPWSTPISITNYNEQFVKIPFYGDIKVTVVNAVRTILLILESFSQAEISASDIRVRLSMQHENEMGVMLHSRANEFEEIRKKSVKVSVSDTMINTALVTAEIEARTVSEETTPSNRMRPSLALSVLHEDSDVDRSRSCSVKKCYSEQDMPKPVHVTSSKSLHQISTIPMRKEWDNFKLNVFLRSVSLVFTSDLEDGGAERHEILNFTCDSIAASIFQTQNMTVSLSVSDIQIDNQLFSRSSFDFPVLIINQNTQRRPELIDLSTDIIKWMDAARENAAVMVDFNIETWREELRDSNVTDLKEIKIKLEPLSLYIEDTYITKLMEYFKTFTPNQLIMWPTPKNSPIQNFTGAFVCVPNVVLWESAVAARPLSLKNFAIEPLSILLSVHSSVKMYIALDTSPLQFGRFERKLVLTTPYRLGHALTMHYLSGAIFGAGWIVGSWELLGSPGGLARAMGTGLRDFVSLPYQGLIQGPWAFLRGITHGSASLMKHVTAGTLQSVTKLASSVARNLDRLTLDEEHLRRTEEQRRQKPQGVGQGLLQGLTGLGISLLGAVGGIAHHPLQSVMSDGASPRSLAAGVGLGLVGVFTKPLSGAAELVALTGQGLLQGAGWNPLPEPRSKPVLYHMYSSTNSVIKYSWKFMPLIMKSDILFVTEATHISHLNYEAIALILTSEALIIVNTDEDTSHRIISLSELTAVENSLDPTLLSLKLTMPTLQAPKSSDECAIEMDPDCRARVADYVRNTVGLMMLSSDLSPEQSEMSISPLETPTPSVDGTASEHTVLSFYVSPQNRNYFLNLFSLAKQLSEEYTFPVL